MQSNIEILKFDIQIIPIIEKVKVEAGIEYFGKIYNRNRVFKEARTCSRATLYCKLNGGDLKDFIRVSDTVKIDSSIYVILEKFDGDKVRCMSIGNCESGFSLSNNSIMYFISSTQSELCD